MRPLPRRAAILAVLIASLAACGPAVEPELAVRVFAGGDAIYPGHEVRCADRCDDLMAEVRRWIGQELRPGAELQSVTWHSMVGEDGHPIVVNRSGGGTSLAVATLTDGSRVALLVGCGVGLDVERCFATR